jgi:Uma2 family endonuclease
LGEYAVWAEEVVMATGVRLFTVEDLETFPEEGNRREVIDGELYVSHAPHAEHQSVVDETGFAIRYWQNEGGSGWLVAGAGVVFSRNDGVIPDLMWFSDAQLQLAKVNPATGEWDGHFYAASDLAIEVISPGYTNEFRDREVKLTLYSRRGVREYWIIDRFSRTVMVYRRTAEAPLVLAETLTERDTITSPLLPGFAVAVERLFRLPKALLW